MLEGKGLSDLLTGQSFLRNRITTLNSNGIRNTQYAAYEVSGIRVICSGGIMS